MASKKRGRNATKGRTERVIPRSTIAFFVGLGLLVNEAVIRSAEADQRPALIGAFLLMMGFPVVEIADVLRNRLLDSWVDDDEDDDQGVGTQEPAP
jgi:hypothetical protein